MDHGGGEHMMQMYFTASAHATILFEKWHTMTAAELFGSCVAVAVGAMLYEGFKVFREYLMGRSMRKKTGSTESFNLEKAKYDGPENFSRNSSSASFLTGSHMIQTLLHFVQLWWSYGLMLVFMTYNIYLCLAVCLGGALGYLLFGWYTPKANLVEDHGTT